MQVVAASPMDTLALAFGVIFVAELGDKSQLMALAMTTRYGALPVLLGVTIGAAVLHAFSVGAGALLGASLPTRPINVIAGLAFIGFAVWTLRGTDAADPTRRDGRHGRSPVVAVASAFFVAELGDKTMLAAITIAATRAPVWTWAGATLGMIGADVVAIVLGARLARSLSARTIRIGAAMTFVTVGVLLVLDGLR